MSLLVVMGSGETAPTMLKAHREVLAASPSPAVMLDTPFGFQLNADELVASTRKYFAESVGTPVEVAAWRRSDVGTVERERSLAVLGRAGWVFAGPGSPTYALRQWRDTPVPGALLDVARRGGTLVFGSAAACTIGTHTIPVYEIYKVGAEPHWVLGLNLLGALTGIDAVVVPHYDNAEGGNHDTRFCYLGEQRLARLEAQLPDEIGILGVDEHTGLVVDTVAATARVIGNGVVTVRRRGVSTTIPPGTVFSLTDVGALLRGERTESGTPPAPAAGPASEIATAIATSLRAAAAAALARFDAAEAGRDPDGCVAAVLDLESAIRAWTADTEQSDDENHARRILRALVVRLGVLARTGTADPENAVRPFVDALLELRGRARAAKDYAASDLVRDRLVAAGVEVRDTPDGVTWGLTG